MSSSCTIAHARLSIFVARLVADYAEAKSLGEVFIYPLGFRVGSESRELIPDMFFLRKDHANRVLKGRIEGSADLAVEVTDPDTERSDRGEKYYEYEQAGVFEYWLLDPNREVAEFYIRDKDGYFRRQVPNNGWISSAAIKDFGMKIQWLWSLPRLSSIRGELGVA